MKKVLYYLTLTILWAIILVLSGALLILIGNISSQYYALIIAILQPRVWLIATGATMLLRPFVYKLIFGEQKSFSKTIAITLIVLGVLATILVYILDLFM